MIPSAPATTLIYDYEPAFLGDGSNDGIHGRHLGFDVLCYLDDSGDAFETIDTLPTQGLAAAAVEDLRAGHAAPVYGPAMARALAELEAKGYFGQEDDGGG